jgi:two-component sensor histidine kinase
MARIIVRDDGEGLPADFEIGRGGGLGMRIVMALAEQTGASVRVHPAGVGSEFVIELPLEARQ